MLHRFVFAAVMLTIAAPASAQQGAAPAEQDVTRETVGDWTVVCAKSGSPCVMEQIGKTAAGETAISFQIERLAQPATVEGKRVEAVANFLTPLGSLLQAGLRVQVDSGAAKGFAFVLCQPNGCIVQAPVDDETLASLRRGARTKLTFSVVAEGRPKPIEASVSLSGFTRAFDSLKK